MSDKTTAFQRGVPSERPTATERSFKSYDGSTPIRELTAPGLIVTEGDVMLERLAKAAEEAAEYPTAEFMASPVGEVTNWPEVVRAVLGEVRRLAAENDYVRTDRTKQLIDSILNEKPEDVKHTEFEVAQAMARTAESMGWKLGAITDGSYELLKAIHEKSDVDG